MTDLAELPPLPEEPTACVVIPARNSAGTLTAAVASALAQPAVTEIVIAVGPSEDDTATLAAELATANPRVRTIANEAGTTPAALNRGIDATSAPVIVRLDAHAELPNGYVERALTTLRATGAANVGGRQVPQADGGFARAVARAMISPLGSGGAQYRGGTQAGPVDTVYLGVFRRAALEVVGGYDEAMLRNQDAELNIRLRRAGFVVWFDPDLAVRYQPRATVTALARQYHEYGRWRRRTARRHRGSLRLRQLVPPVLTLVLPLAAVASIVLRHSLPFAVVWGVYGAVLLAEGARVSDHARRGPATALALLVMHVSWGLGFLLGPPSSASTVRPSATGDP